MALLSPTGHLGFTPIEEASFQVGVARGPDAVVADSGSCDIGPHPLGADEQASPRTWQEHDLRLIFTAARRLGVPMIIGSCSDTGTDRGVRQYAAYLRRLAGELGVPRFRMATIYSDVDLEALRRRVAAGARVEGLDGRPPLTLDDIDATTHAVAVMGAEPIREALRRGADVILAGRASDASLFAAPLLEAGLPAGVAYYAGKVLECASFCAEPFAGKESVLGVVEPEQIVAEPMSDYQRCTPTSLASHAMYERLDPFREVLPGGYVDMTACRYEAVDERRTRVTGSRWVPAERYTVKLEGAGRVGERALMIIGIRDPYTIARVDEAVAWSRRKVAERFRGPGYQVHYHIYGKNAVMGELEPVKEIRSHELGIVVEAVAPTRDEVAELANLAGRNFMYARLPGLRGTAGAAAFLSDEVLPARAAYRWTMNHVVEVDDPLELFRLEVEEVG
ncbi:hypothetical protein LIP_2926 [Limnochorda pilosa]|uniref:Acyclic terpene utilisation N-terminal domain-containing protein n=2 Tax=Limnochorda pilosa TaxID=1555112 RepID=A0A0K2SNR8_LIMPI|nr:hypothetical protein LIP_2926 [Limnochorda pilosa]